MPTDSTAITILSTSHFLCFLQQRILQSVGILNCLASQYIHVSLAFRLWYWNNILEVGDDELYKICVITCFAMKVFTVLMYVSGTLCA